MHDNVIFREYDIRGVFEEQFDLDFVYNLGRAYVTYLLKTENLSSAQVTIGHDARHSSPSIVKALAKGMMDCGAKVIHLGMVTTPICYYSTFALEGVNGAIMVTGSHNPPEYNGFKVSVGKSTIFGDKIQELRKIIDSNNYVSGKGSESNYDIFPEYIERYSKEFGKLKDLNVVLDCGNGTAGVIARKLYEVAGLKPTILFEEPDGNFPNHHPDPTVEKNLVHLKKTVLEKGAVVGIGFDGDSDRIGVVDHTGRMIMGDELMVIISRSVLEKNPGAAIIGDVKCSDRLYHDITKHGGRAIMWKTGHSLIKEKIKVENAPFGGEMSGHIFFTDRNYGYDDALYAGLRLCEIISETGKSIPELLEGLPPAFNTPEIRIDTTEEKKVAIVETLKRKFSENSGYEVNLIDGIRISYPNGWALARASNTQPVLVLRFEADSQEHLDSIQNEIRSVVDPLL